MNRQQALNVIWKRLIFIFSALLLATTAIYSIPSDAKLLCFLFVFGNMGSYISIHKGLANLQDDEVVKLSSSWVGLIAPSFVGGLLSIVLYVLFLSGIVEGDMFPSFVPNNPTSEGVEGIFKQHAEGGMKDYAKLLFWGFVAGYNQKYVVDIIDSIKSKA